MSCRKTEIAELLGEVWRGEEMRPRHPEPASHNDREQAAIGFGDVFKERFVHAGTRLSGQSLLRRE